MRKPATLSLLLALCAVTVAVPAVSAADRAQGDTRLLVDHTGGELEMLLHGPSADFFGFHGLPADDHQRQLVISGAALLRDAGTMFRLSPAAGCRIEEVALSGAILEASGQAGTHAPGDALERLRDRDVPLGGRPAPEPTASTPDAASGDEREPDSLGIHARYRYRCSRPDALDQIAVQVFTSFPAIGLMAVEVDLAGQRSSRDLDASAPIIELRAQHD